MRPPLLELDLGDLDMLDAEMVGETFGDNMVAAFQAAPAPVPSPAASLIPGAITSGNRDENALTDLEFFARHPERSGVAIQKSDKALAREWLNIRNDVVRPALARVGTPPRPAGTPAPAPTPGSNAAVAEQVVADTKRNQIIGLALGGLAAIAIGVGVATR